jgi:hypothetical protein
MMSQYPSPYYPPSVHPQYTAPVDLLAPARRASIMMFILGPLLLSCGGCFIVLPLMFSMVPPEQLQPTLDKLREKFQMDPGLVMRVVGAIVALPGIALLILAFFVRRGGRVSIALSMVIVGLILLKSLIEIPLTLLHPDPDAIGGLCGDVFSLGIFGLLFAWLLQALRQSSNIQLAQQQYAAQYWQYQQNMQAYSAYTGQQLPPVPQPPPPINDRTPPPTGG